MQNHLWSPPRSQLLADGSPRPATAASHAPEGAGRAFDITRDPNGAIGVGFHDTIVHDVAPGGPAYRAGVFPGIPEQALAGSTIRSHADATAALAAAPQTLELVASYPLPQCGPALCQQSPQRLQAEAMIRAAEALKSSPRRAGGLTASPAPQQTSPAPQWTSPAPQPTSPHAAPAAGDPAEARALPHGPPAEDASQAEQQGLVEALKALVGQLERLADAREADTSQGGDQGTAAVGPSEQLAAPHDAERARVHSTQEPAQSAEACRSGGDLMQHCDLGGEACRSQSDLVPYSGLRCAPSEDCSPGSPRSAGSPRACIRSGLAVEGKLRAKSGIALCATDVLEKAAKWALPPSDVPPEVCMPSLIEGDGRPQATGGSALAKVLVTLAGELPGTRHRIIADVECWLEELLTAPADSTAALLAKAREMLLRGARCRDALLQGPRVPLSSGPSIVLTDATKEAAAQVADALEGEVPVLLEGPTGTGKTMISHLALKLVAARTEQKKELRLLRFNLSASIEPEDLLHRWVADPHRGGAITLPQPLALAAEHGHVVLLDEMNLACEAALNVIEAVIDHGAIAVSDPTRWGATLRQIKVHENFRIIATQNPAGAAGYEGRRNKLSEAFLSRFRRVPLHPTGQDDLARVVTDRFLEAGVRAGGRTSRRLAVAMVKGHYACRGLDDDPVLGCVTVRDLLRWVEGCPAVEGQHFDDSAIAETGWLCYCARYRDKAARQKHENALLKPLREAFDRAFSVAGIEEVGHPSKGENMDDPSNGTESDRGDGYVMKGTCFALLRHRLLRGARMRRPLMLLGEEGSGKTRAVQELCQAEGWTTKECLMTTNTETAALVGQYLPSGSGGVEWVNGCVSDAWDNGKTLVLDDIHAAPATVCERLNAVTEFPSVWSVPEKSDTAVEAILEPDTCPEVHPNFRVIATCADVSKLTPAFVNRFIVIAHEQVTEEDKECIAGEGAEGLSLLQAVRLRNARNKHGKHARWILGLRQSEDEVSAGGGIPTDLREICEEVKEAQRKRLAAVRFAIERDIVADESQEKVDTLEKLAQCHPFDEQVRRGATVLSLGIPVLVKGAHGTGVFCLAEDIAVQHSGKPPIVFVADSDTTTADLVGSATLDGKGCPGPLLRAWLEDRVIIIRGMGRIPGGVLADISAVLHDSKKAGTVCEMLAPQVRFEDPTVEPQHFGVIGTLYGKKGRREEEGPAACRNLFIDVYVPCPEEAWRAGSGAAGEGSGDGEATEKHGGLYTQLAKVCGLPAAAEAAATLHSAAKFTPRSFVCITRRAQLLGCEEEGLARRWARCCASWLLPALRPDHPKRRRIAEALSKSFKYTVGTGDEDATVQDVAAEGQRDTVRFSQWGLYCDLEGKISEMVARALDPAGAEPAALLKKALCSLAFAYKARQPLILLGPSSFKTFALRLFTSILGIELLPVQISAVITAQDLLGSASPTTRQEEKGWFKVKGKPAKEEQGPSQTDGATGVEAAGGDLQLRFEEAVITKAVRRKCAVVLDGAELASVDLLADLSPLIRTQKTTIEVSGIGPRTIRMNDGAAFFFTACPPATALRMVEGVASHWCRPYSCHALRTILTGHLRLSGLRFDVPSAAYVADIFADKFGECCLREQLRLATLVCGLAGSDTGEGRGGALKKADWESAMDTVCSLFHPDDSTGVRKSEWGGDKCPLLFEPDDHVKIGDRVRISCVKSTPEEWAERVDKLRVRVHTGAPTFARNMARVCLAAERGFSVALQGPPGTGKTLVAEQAARLLGHEFRRVQLGPGSSEADVYGSLMPTRRRGSTAGGCTQGGPQSYAWTYGVVSGAIHTFNEKKRKGEGPSEQKLWLCLDELNLAPHAVLQCLLPVLSASALPPTDRHFVIPQTSDKISLEHVVVIVTMNPASVGGGREPLPLSVSSCLIAVTVESMSPEEVAGILRKGRVDPHHYQQEQSVDQELAKQLLDVHHSALAALEGHGMQHECAVNLRTLETFVQCFGPLVKGDKAAHRRFCAALSAVYCAGHEPGRLREALEDAVRCAAQELDVLDWQSTDEARIAAMVPPGFAKHSEGPPLIYTDELRHTLASLAAVHCSGRAVLLHGPPAGGKTVAVRELARLRRRELVVLPAHLFTDEGDLVGQVCVSGMDEAALTAARKQVSEQLRRIIAAISLHVGPCSDSEKELSQMDIELASSDGNEAAMRRPIEQLLKLLQKATALWGKPDADSAAGAAAAAGECGRSILARYEQFLATLVGHMQQLQEIKPTSVSFHFVESAVVHAAFTGKWLLIEGIDRAPPTAVERLNPLLEAWATLDLIERHAVDRADSRPLSPEDGIHADFRLFATASSGRGALSSALLNRMICIHVAQPCDPSFAKWLDPEMCPGSDASSFWQQALRTLTSLEQYSERASPEVARAAQLRALLHGVRAWQRWINGQVLEQDKAVGFRSLVYHVLEALAAGCAEADDARRAAEQLVPFLNVWQQETRGPGKSGHDAQHVTQKVTGMEKVSLQLDGLEDLKKNPLEKQKKQDDAEDEDSSKRREAEEQTERTDEALQKMWQLKAAKPGQKEIDVILDEKKSRAVVAELRELWQEQPGTVLEEMVRCIHSRDPALSAEHIRDKAAELAVLFRQKERALGHVELFLLWWYSCEGVDVDRICGFAVSPPKWEWVQSTRGAVKEIQVEVEAMKIELFKQKTHSRITSVPAAIPDKYVGRWMGPVFADGKLCKLEDLQKHPGGADEDPATFTVRPRVWQEYAGRRGKQMHAEEEQLNYEQEYNKKWSSKRNGNIYNAMVNVMREATGSTSALSMAGSIVKSTALLVHLGWRPQGGGDMMLFRGMSKLPEDVAHKYADLAPGETIVMANPSSTSVELSAALKFVRGKAKLAVVFCIAAPKGVGIPMYVSQYPGEMEVLLPPFAKMTITKVIKHGEVHDGPVHVGDLELSQADTKRVLEKATLVLAKLEDCDMHADKDLMDLVESDLADANTALRKANPKLRELSLRAMLGVDPEPQPHAPQSPPETLLSELRDQLQKAYDVGSAGDQIVTVEQLAETGVTLSSSLPTFKANVPKARSCPERPWGDLVKGLDLSPDLVAEVAAVLRSASDAGSVQKGPPAARGSRLHPRGLVRAIATRFTYRRIFVGRAVSGSRVNAAVMLLVDKAAGRRQLVVLALLQQALWKLGIEAGVMVHQGNDIWCVHPPAEQWNNVAGAALLNVYAAKDKRKMLDCSSALYLAASAVADIPAVTRKVLWLTQGDSGTFQAKQRFGCRRAAVLAGAEQAGVDVIGIGLMADDSGAGLTADVHHSVNKAISLSSVYDLPTALKKLFTEDCDPLIARATAAELCPASAKLPNVKPQAMLELFGPELLTKSGSRKPTASVLRGMKAVLIFFSGHWCPPSKAFTPQFIEWYKRNHAKAGFEVVFVSSDNSAEEFDDYFGSMPWTALPYEDRKRKKELSTKFKVSGIPTLLVMSHDGRLITSNGRAKVSEDEEAEDFPWAPLTFAQCLGETLIKQGGAKVRTQDAIAGKTLALYFGANWCPPCRAFTPNFREFYAEYKKLEPNFEAIFSSGDKSNEAAEEYFREKHGDYLMIPYDHEKGRSGLDEMFGVEGIPTVIICDSQGKVINASGRSKVSNGAESAAKVKAEGWDPPLFGDLDDGPEALGKDINDCKTVVVLMHGLPDLIDQVCAAITPVAQEYKDKGGEDGPECIFLISKSEGGVVDRIHELTKKNGGPRCEEPCSDGYPLVMLFDLPSGGAFYVSAMTEVTSDALRAFIADPGERCQLGR
eukprot:TRINITY_DN7621_c0_g3_i1.p1 TRINITY_DN7621_c0_g3~~TRINITY_DN7621_c0_g3_i1.p1  ORF type:complete len:3783 (+),score=730.83 TRINITY_DN7621_c0_g3_i1:78-11351(+)